MIFINAGGGITACGLITAWGYSCRDWELFGAIWEDSGAGGFEYNLFPNSTLRGNAELGDNNQVAVALVIYLSG